MNRVKHLGRVSTKVPRGDRDDLLAMIVNLQGEVEGLSAQLTETMNLLTRSESERGLATANLQRAEERLRRISDIRSGYYPATSDATVVITARIKAAASLTFPELATETPFSDLRQERLRKAIPIIDVAFATQMRQITKTVSEVCPGIRVEGSLDWEVEGQDSQSAD